MGTFLLTPPPPLEIQKTVKIERFNIILNPLSKNAYTFSGKNIFWKATYVYDPPHLQPAFCGYHEGHVLTTNYYCAAILRHHLVVANFCNIQKWGHNASSRVILYNMYASIELPLR